MHERDVDEPGPGRDVGEVDHPQLVRAGCALNWRSTRSCGRATAGSAVVVRGLARPDAPRPARAARISRSTVQRATVDALTAQLLPHLAGPIDAVVVRMDPPDLRDQLRVADHPRHSGWSLRAA